MENRNENLVDAPYQALPAGQNIPPPPPTKVSSLFRTQSTNLLSIKVLYQIACLAAFLALIAEEKQTRSIKGRLEELHGSGVLVYSSLRGSVVAFLSVLIPAKIMFMFA
jgi:hypothetical protein